MVVPSGVGLAGALSPGEGTFVVSRGGNALALGSNCCCRKHHNKHLLMPYCVPDSCRLLRKQHPLPVAEFPARFLFLESVIPIEISAGGLGSCFSRCLCLRSVCLLKLWGSEQSGLALVFHCECLAMLPEQSNELCDK